MTSCFTKESWTAAPSASWTAECRITQQSIKGSWEAKPASITQEGQFSDSHSPCLWRYMDFGIWNLCSSLCGLCPRIESQALCLQGQSEQINSSVNLWLLYYTLLASTVRFCLGNWAIQFFFFLKENNKEQKLQQHINFSYKKWQWKSDLAISLKRACFSLSTESPSGSGDDKH